MRLRREEDSLGAGVFFSVGEAKVSGENHQRRVERRDRGCVSQTAVRKLERSSAVGLCVLRTNYNFGSVVPNRRLHLVEMMTRF